MPFEKSDHNISLEMIRSGDRTALDLVTPPLNNFITKELKECGLFSRQIRDSIFDDVIFDLCRKENLPKGIIDPVPYLLGMAKNIIKRYLDNGEFNFRSEENYANRADPESGIEKDEGIDKCIESIKVLLNKLPKSYAEIIEDYWLKGKTLSDICEDRNYKSLKTLSSMKSQALKALLKIIEECDNHHELKFWLRRMENNKENGKKL